MKSYILAGCALALAATTPTLAQSAFDGTWKVDLKSAELSKKPQVILLKGGVFDCSTCIPPEHVMADGAFHPIVGSPYFDAMSIKVVGDRKIEEVDKKGGKIVANSTSTLSADGMTTEVEYSDSSATNGAPVTGKGVMRRVGKAPAGASPLSGSWVNEKVSSVSDNGLFETFKVVGDSLTLTTPTGQSYKAPLTGADAPMMGDPGITSVSVKRLSATSIREIDKRKDKVIAVLDMTVSADGKVLTVVADNKLSGMKTTLKAYKQ